MKQLKYIIICCALLICSQLVFAQSEFNNENITVVDATADSTLNVFAADLNNDGNEDILTILWQRNRPSTIGWYANDGRGNFGALNVISEEESESWDVIAEDLDYDGDLDVVTAAYRDSLISWYENLGDGTFGPRTIISDKVIAPLNVYAADIDGDNIVDVLSASGIDNKLAWYKNDGEGNFGFQRIITNFLFRAVDVVTADIDNDGDEDVIGGSLETGVIDWFENDGTGSFSNGRFINNQHNQLRKLATGDLNKDGFIDLVAVSRDDNKIAYYQNNGDKTFAAQNVIANGFGAHNLELVDFDEDGLLDIVIAEMFGDKISWVKNLGDNEFSDAFVISNQPDLPINVTVADFDNDGDIDVASASYEDGIVAWYENLFILDRVRGKVAIETDFDCNINSQDVPLPKTVISVDNIIGSTFGIADEAGNYKINAQETGAYQLDVSPPGRYWNSCVDESIVNLANRTTYIDIPIEAAINSPEMQVAIDLPFLEHNANNTYTVNYCNVGTVSGLNAEVKIELDEFMTMVNATAAFTTVDARTFTFNVGDVASLECGSFQFTINLDNADAGQNHCVKASISPNEYVGAAPTDWDNSEIDVSIECEEDSVVFRIKNIKPFPMTYDGNIFVAEENIVFKQETFNLGANEELVFRRLATTATYFLKAEQSPNHPNRSRYAIAFLEGCNNIYSPSVLNQYPKGDDELYVDINCQTSNNAASSNQRSADIIGYGNDRLIDKNTPIEYKFNFQNTGADATNTITLIDTLSPNLDPHTLRMTVSSHPYTYTITENGILTITFKDINLPSSNSDFNASFGFVSYKINQKSDLEEGVEIINKSHFDFDGLRITPNQIKHKIGEGIRPVVTSIFETKTLANQIYPNPSNGIFNIELKEQQSGNIRIVNSLGAVVFEKVIAMNSNLIPMDISFLSNGIYQVSLISDKDVYLLNTITVQH